MRTFPQCRVGRGPGDAFCLIMPCFAFLRIDFIGQMFVHEIFLLVVFSLLFFKAGNVLLCGFSRNLIIFGISWLVSQIITDLIRSTPFQDWARGWAGIAFFIVDFCALYLLLYGNKRRLIYFGLGLSAGAVIDCYVNFPNYRSLEMLWKFGLGNALALYLFAFIQTDIMSRRDSLVVPIVLLFAAMSIYVGSRGLGLIVFMTGCYIWLCRISRPSESIRINTGSIVTVLAVFIISGVVVGQGYRQAVLSGWLGDVALHKYMMQSRRGGSMLDILLGGRSESIASLAAISDSPIIGHGSWAKDPRYAHLMFDVMKEMGYNPQRSRRDLIPTHSYIFGAWVNSGILGGFFWLWLFSFAIKPLLVMYRFRYPLMPLTVFLGLNFVWSIWFSPFGANARVQAAYLIVLLISAWDEMEATSKNHELRRKTRQYRGQVP